MYAHLAGRKARCDGDICTHVLEAASGIERSSETGITYNMTTHVERPLPFDCEYFENPELSLRG